LHITMGCDSLTKTGSCAASTIGSNITSLANVLSISCLAMKLANSWPYHSKRFLSIISLQHFTPELYHRSAPVSTFAEPRIRLFPRYFFDYLPNALPTDMPRASVLNKSFPYREL